MTDRLIRAGLAPFAYAASAVLWPWCVVAAYWCRTWGDQFDDAALALAGHDQDSEGER